MHLIEGSRYPGSDPRDLRFEFDRKERHFWGAKLAKSKVQVSGIRNCSWRVTVHNFSDSNTRGIILCTDILQSVKMQSTCNSLSCLCLNTCIMPHCYALHLHEVSCHLHRQARNTCASFLDHFHSCQDKATLL